MGSESEPVRTMNTDAINQVVKKIVTTFFTANVPYVRGLDIYGSIHVRSDDTDIVCCVFNEHCCKPDRRANAQDRESAPLVPGTMSSQQGASASNASSGNEYLPDWMGQTIGGGTRFGGKRQQCGPEEGKGDATGSADEQQSKRKKLPGLSRKLSKLNRAVVNLQYPAQSVFPEPMPFGEGGRNAENQKFHVNTSSEVKHGCSVTDQSQCNEGNNSAKLQHKLEGHGTSTDEPGDDAAMVMASSDAETPRRSGMRLDRTGEGDLVDLDSGDSHDFDQSSEKVAGLFQFSSQQSFNHSTTFSTFSLPSVSFNDSEMFTQASWMPPPSAEMSNSRQGNQVACTDSGFDGSSTKGIGPLTCEKICVYCLKIFHSNLEMSQHIQQEHNSGFPLLENADDRPYRPRYQNAYAYGGSELDIDRQLTCSVCSLSFRSLDGLRCHENSKHSRNKLYKCQFCTQSFLTRQAAYTHRMKFHRLIPRKPQLLAGPMTPI